jgi:hypothetical protein
MYSGKIAVPPGGGGIRDKLTSGQRKKKNIQFYSAQTPNNFS